MQFLLAMVKGPQRMDKYKNTGINILGMKGLIDDTKPAYTEVQRLNGLNFTIP